MPAYIVQVELRSSRNSEFDDHQYEILDGLMFSKEFTKTVTTKNKQRLSLLRGMYYSIMPEVKSEDALQKVKETLSDLGIQYKAVVIQVSVARGQNLNELFFYDFALSPDTEE